MARLRADADAVRKWWRTSIIDMKPGQIAFRGHPIQDLIGNASFGQMIWLMVQGDMPSAAEAALFECALVAGVDLSPFYRMLRSPRSDKKRRMRTLSLAIQPLAALVCTKSGHSYPEPDSGWVDGDEPWQFYNHSDR